MEIECQNCGAIFEALTEKKLVIASLLECLLCDRKTNEEIKSKQEPFPYKVPVKKIVKKKAPVKQVKQGGQKKYPDEVEVFLENNIDHYNNDKLVKQINEQWSLGITKSKLSAYMAYKKIKRDKKVKAPADEAGDDSDNPIFNGNEDN